MRHPLAQISSFTAHTNKSYDFVVKTMKAVLPRMPATSSANSSYIITQFEQVIISNTNNGNGSFILFLFLFFHYVIIYSFASLCLLLDT